MVGKNPKGPNCFLHMQFCTALASFLLLSETSMENGGQPQGQTTWRCSVFFPQWHGCQKRIDNLSEEMLKFPSSKNKKGLPNTRVKATSFAELSPFTPLAFKKGEVKKISFDTCLALKTDYFGLQNG